MNQILKNSAISFLAEAILFLISLTSGVLIARILGPALRGDFALLQTTPVIIVTFVSMGLSKANVVFIASERYSFQRIIKMSIFSSAMLSAIGYLLCLIASYFLADNILSGYSTNVLFLVGLLIPISIFRNQALAIARALNSFLLLAIIKISHGFLYLIFVVFLVAFLDYGVLGALMASYIPSMLTSLYIYCRYVTNFTRIHVIADPRFRVSLKEYFSFGSSIQINNILWFLILRADIYIVKLLCSDSDVGVYSLAASLSEKLWLVSGSLGLVLLPYLSSLKDELTRGIKTARAIRMILICLLPICIIISLLANWFFARIYGIEYADAVIPFIILTFAAVAYAVRNMLGEYFVSNGRMHINSISRGIALTINIFLNFLLIPVYGIVGAAIASLIAYTIDTIVGATYYIRLTNLSYSVLIPQMDDIHYLNRIVTDFLKRKSVS